MRRTIRTASEEAAPINTIATSQTKLEIGSSSRRSRRSMPKIITPAPTG